MDSLSFRTRARTIDHLGREQIADCPTAISELWKNAYDAYAEHVALHIYDGNIPIAALMDDGHGMDRDDFVGKWLVVGTESKASGGETPVDDRNGLPLRPKQGQKGIGRLSSAALGPLLLVVSKRRTAPFVAALIDWRLFENPFLYLQDIEVPIVEFGDKSELFPHLPAMFDALMGNLQGTGKDAARDQRIVQAWREFDALELSEGRSSTRETMENTVAEAVFETRHLEQWPVWRGEKEHGTILLIADIHFDLEAHIERRVHPEESGAAEKAREQFLQTLSSFTDPFATRDEIAEGYGSDHFDYSVTVWEGVLRRPIISDERAFDLASLENLEHVVKGVIDESGIFVGKVKAFGCWIEEEIRIRPEGDVPTRANSKVGPFHIRFGTFQQEARSSSHPAEVHQNLTEQALRYGGFMVYRNGLRVMPYGREDNDFFEIEKRRTKHAGRYFWSNRRTFGRVAITRDGNPNLKDKAGREGIIDNKSSKIFRDLVENILITTARKYFGTDSDFQKQYLPEIQEERAREKAEAERKKQRARRRQQFRGNLKRLAPEMASCRVEAETLSERLRQGHLGSEGEILELREQVKEIRDRFKGFTLGEAPKELGTLEVQYGEYRRNQRAVAEGLTTLEQSLNAALEAVKPRAPKEIAYSDLSSHAAFIQRRLRKWQKEAKGLLDSEQSRLAALYEERTKLYHTRTLPLLDQVEQGGLTLTDCLEKLAAERDKIDSENAETFEPYIAALRSLQENIDLETLAAYGMDMAEEMRSEMNRLHALAQLGITVEIIGHEIEGLEMTVSAGLNELPEAVKQTPTFQCIRAAQDQLTDRLRFLSPLKLSGGGMRSHLDGAAILRYVERFFGTSLADNGITLIATPAFLRFSIYEQASRLFPVFINLINNAAYWIRQTRESERRIVLDAREGRIVVADDGSGVEEDDRKYLFTLFFTRKVRSGRGVGLYLCRANLAVGGHTIQYATEERFKVLPGANFVIDLKGASYV
jgi:signal transduction histidine kinase